jgi:4-diphosphocytidyl-2-C-methyl-D-erythritol kinase
MNEIIEFAPAKLNLYLHITARRPDGYHDLDSLAAFASIGDWVCLRPASSLSLDVDGPFASALAHEDPSQNLIVKAVQSFASFVGRALDVKFLLTKNLPVASGIGGGSSDAAAALRALAKYWGIEADDERVIKAAALYGQDVPLCLKIENSYLTAEGSVPAPRLPPVDVVLINPNIPLPTPDVYRAYRKLDGAFSPLSRLSSTPNSALVLAAALKARNNDLYKPACALVPEIADVINALADTKGCLLARMSGSGATCFALYASSGEANEASRVLRDRHPTWWIEAGLMNV